MLVDEFGGLWFSEAAVLAIGLVSLLLVVWADAGLSIRPLRRALRGARPALSTLALQRKRRVDHRIDRRWNRVPATPPHDHPVQRLDLHPASTFEVLLRRRAHARRHGGGQLIGIVDN